MKRKNKIRFDVTFLICALVVSIVAGLSCSDSDDSTNPLKPEPVNHPPVIAELGDTSTTVGSTIYFKPVAYDPDNDPLQLGGYVHFTYADLQVGTMPIYEWIDESGVLEFKPQAYDRPGREVTLSVIDGRGGKAHTTFYVYVN